MMMMVMMMTTNQHSLNLILHARIRYDIRICRIPLCSYTWSLPDSRHLAYFSYTRLCLENKTNFLYYFRQSYPWFNV